MGQEPLEDAASVKLVKGRIGAEVFGQDREVIVGRPLCPRALLAWLQLLPEIAGDGRPKGEARHRLGFLADASAASEYL